MEQGVYGQRTRREATRIMLVIETGNLNQSMFIQSLNGRTNLLFVLLDPNNETLPYFFDLSLGYLEL